MGCVQQLAVHDVSPSSAASGTSGGLWLAGAEGIFQPSVPLPFTVDHQRLYCNSHSGDVHPCGAGAPYPDVYALVFTPTSGEPPLSLTSSWTGTIVVTTVPELQQHLGIRTLRSFQSDRCDDYYNWGWWAAGHAGPGGQLE
jgi:hypothetical protein